MPDVDTSDAAYDALHEATHRSPLLWQLWAQAFGDEYPSEVEAFSSCSWWLLGNFVSTLRLRPDSLLVDLGCGRGGPGLWLARAMRTRLIGVDHSEAAVRLAAQRAPEFVGPDRASFRQGTLEATGLPDGCADGVVSMDAFGFAADRAAALRELRRLLAERGTAVLTARERPADQPDWDEFAASAGLRVERSLVIPEVDGHWDRLYEQWLAHEAQLREELGDRVATNLINEARTGLPADMRTRRAVLVVLRPDDPAQA
jgi:ubiquinone/menaquinone biosynthesis C-methylase UbiE